MAALFGGLGLISVFVWPFSRCHRQIVWIQMYGAICFSAYFSLHGATIASVSCLISAGQLFARRTCSNLAILVPLFLASSIGLMALSSTSHSGSLATLAICGSFFGTCARLQTSTLRMKAFFLMGSPLWLLHNLLIGGYFAIAVDVVSVLTNGITLARTLETLGLAASGRGGKSAVYSRELLIAA